MSTAALPDKKVGGSEIIFLHPPPLLLNLYIRWGLLGNHCWSSKPNGRAQGSEFGNPRGQCLGHLCQSHAASSQQSLSPLVHTSSCWLLAMPFRTPGLTVGGGQSQHVLDTWPDSIIVFLMEQGTAKFKWVFLY